MRMKLALFLVLLGSSLGWSQNKVSKIRVIVPMADAELTIENKATTSTGTERVFESPPLDPKKRYEYLFVATWRPNNYTVMTRPRTVKFQGGDELVVDLTKDTDADKAVIRFVPTPEDIVDAMIKLAQIGKEDVVFEPGCGDGRMIIAAVKAGAKKAVGIDLDPERIKEAKASVQESKLTGKIEIRQGDALEVKDYNQATVMLLYMGDEFNLILRPKIVQEMKVGSRIVSHRFLMGDWKPDTTKQLVGIDGDEYEIHLWKITEEVKKKYGKK